MAGKKAGSGRKGRSHGDETPGKPVVHETVREPVVVEPLTGRTGARSETRATGRAGAGDRTDDGKPVPMTFVDGDGDAYTVNLTNSGLPAYTVMAKSKEEAVERFKRHSGIISTANHFQVGFATDDKGKKMDRKAALNAARASQQKENPGLGIDGGDPSGPLPGGRSPFAPGAQPPQRFGPDDEEIELDPGENPDDDEE